MFPPLPELRHARILISNDDGVYAPGIAVLERIARTLSDDVWVVAPESEQSATGHSLTLQRPLRIRQLSERRFAVDGSPTDCALLALNHILADRPPDLVLSGVNHGGNLCEDLTYSGTVAVAMEATLLGVPSIALSQYIPDGGVLDLSVAEAWGERVLRRLVALQWPRSVLLSVNFPACAPDAVTGMQAIRHGKRKVSDSLTQGLDPRGRPYFWIGPSLGAEDVGWDTDMGVVSANGIAVTPVSLDMTHRPTLKRLQDLLAAPV